MPDPVDPKQRFSDRVADYVRARPGYPPGLLPALAELTGLDPEWVVADFGSGTGLSARPFVEHGNTVFAVEPNEEMRRAAERLLGAHAGFESVAGSAESTGLPDDSVDLVIAAQAFHWFDPVATREECRRILREPRWAAVVWNVRRTDADDFARAYETLLERWGTDYLAYRARRIEPEELMAFFRRPPEERHLSNEQVFDFDGLRARLLSSSYVPSPSHPDHAPMMLELDRIFDEHADTGRVRFEYDTQLFAGLLD